MAITFKRETSAQIGKGLICASCRAVISGSSRIGSIASLATETADGEILV